MYLPGRFPSHTNSYMHFLSTSEEPVVATLFSTASRLLLTFHSGSITSLLCIRHKIKHFWYFE